MSETPLERKLIEEIASKITQIVFMIFKIIARILGLWAIILSLCYYNEGQIDIAVYSLALAILLK